MSQASDVKYKIAFFSFSWNRDNPNSLDHYQSMFLEKMVEFGWDVDIYIGNQYTDDFGINGQSKRVNWQRLQNHIYSNDYDWALSFNSSLICDNVLNALRCPVSIVLIDDLSHLFKHDNSNDLFQSFKNRAHVFASSSELVFLIQNNSECHIDRTHFIPTATSRINSSAHHNVSQICFVASFLETNGLSMLLDAEKNNQKAMDAIQYAMHAVENKVSLSNEQLSNVNYILNKHGWDFNFLKMQIENSLSNKWRLDLVREISNLGLVLYGNALWLYQLSSLPNIISFFKTGSSIKSHSDLMRIYNSSKLSINVPQFQVGSALPFRVIDIMASKSLLITKYDPSSDLYKIFGNDCPVPTYRTIDELKELCVYYLNNELERQVLVKQCNQLVSEGYEFETRIMQYSNIAGAKLEKLNRIGSKKFINSNDFNNFISRENMLVIIKSVIRKCFTLLPASLRWKISNQLRF